MLFNIYYMNFSKVYEIKMIISNVIKISQEELVERASSKEKGGTVSGEIEGKLGVKFLNFGSLRGTVDGNISKTNSQTSKLIETFEVKATKSVILSEVLERSKIIKTDQDISSLKEGSLIRIDNVKLVLENETELRTAKLLNGGILKGLRIPEAQGLDMNNIFNSMFKDYAYKFRGDISGCDEKILSKIPLSFENEFENEYSVDDLFIGRVCLLGIYKGPILARDLSSTFQYFTDLDAKPDEGGETLSIQPSQYVKENKEPVMISASNNQPFHYIDLLAIVQTVDVTEGLQQ